MSETNKFYSIFSCYMRPIKKDEKYLSLHLSSVIAAIALLLIFSYSINQSLYNASAVQQKKQTGNITSSQDAIGKSSSKAALELMNSVSLGSGSRYVSMMESLMNTTAKIAKVHANTTMSSDIRAGNNSMSMTDR